MSSPVRLVMSAIVFCLKYIFLRLLFLTALICHDEHDIRDSIPTKSQTATQSWLEGSRTVGGMWDMASISPLSVAGLNIGWSMHRSQWIGSRDQ